MPDEIQPALAPEEWSSVERSEQTIIARTLEPLSRGGLFRRIQVWTPEAIQVMALANAALPNDDPRKITHADVDAILAAAYNQAGLERRPPLRAVAAKLAALLPPE